MPPKVKLPLVGEVNRNVAIVGGLGGVGLAGILYYRYRKNSQASTTQSLSMVSDPAGNQCTQEELSGSSTGYCPGSPEDQAQLQGNSQAYGIGAGYGESGIGSGYGSLCPDGSTPTGYDQYGNPICPQGSGTGSSAATTNDEWYSEVTAQFPAWGTALQGVLGGNTVTTAQKDQFLSAVGIFGAPPQGYPQPIKTSDTPGQPGPPGPPNKIKVPSVVGQRAEEADQAITKAGLHFVNSPKINPKTANYVTSQSPKGDTEVSAGTTVHLSLRQGK